MNDYSRLPSKTAANLETKLTYSQSAVSNIFFLVSRISFLPLNWSDYNYKIPTSYPLNAVCIQGSPGCIDEIPRDIHKSV